MVDPLTDRFRNPRRGDPELSRRLGEGEPETRHEVHRQASPHGRDPAPPTPHPVGEEHRAVSATGHNLVAFHPPEDGLV